LGEVFVLYFKDRKKDKKQEEDKASNENEEGNQE
jgi:hypothetical protein